MVDDGVWLCKTPGGYTYLSDVKQQHNDKLTEPCYLLLEQQSEVLCGPACL